MGRSRRLFLRTDFLIPSTAGSTLFALATLLPAYVQVAVLGVALSVLIGLVFSLLGNQSRDRELFLTLSEINEVPQAVASDPEYLKIHSELTESLARLTGQSDPLLRDVARARLLEMVVEVAAMSEGEIVFHDTESWRNVYDALLKTEGLQTYRSVAWVQSLRYWQDTPGRQSMRANYDAVKQGLVIERVAILPAELWPDDGPPDEKILWWLIEQHENGVWVLIAREKEVSREPGLPDDFGIYGERAVGFHSMDQSGLTARFRLYFTEEQVRLAQKSWERLRLHATPLQDLLD